MIIKAMVAKDQGKNLDNNIHITLDVKTTTPILYLDQSVGLGVTQTDSDDINSVHYNMAVNEIEYTFDVNNVEGYLVDPDDTDRFELKAQAVSTWSRQVIDVYWDNKELQVLIIPTLQHYSKDILKNKSFSIDAIALSDTERSGYAFNDLETGNANVGNIPEPEAVNKTKTHMMYLPGLAEDSVFNNAGFTYQKDNTSQYVETAKVTPIQLVSLGKFFGDTPVMTNAVIPKSLGIYKTVNVGAQTIKDVLIPLTF